MCMVHSLNISHMDENGHWKVKVMSPDPPGLSAYIPQSGLRKETSEPCAG